MQLSIFLNASLVGVLNSKNNEKQLYELLFNLKQTLSH